MALRMPRLVLSLRITNSIGVVGDNHRGRFLKSIHVNFGQYLFLHKPSNRLAMEKARKNFRESVQVSCLQTLLVEKIETCQTFEFGRIIRLKSPKSMACQHPRKMPSWMQSIKTLQRSTRIPCRENWPTSFLDVWRISWICKGQIMQWMLHAPHRWRPSWMHVASYRHVKPMSCSQEQRIERWIQQPMPSLVQLGLFHRHTRRRSTPERMDSSWVKVQGLWYSNALAMLSLMMTRFTQSFVVLGAQAMAVEKASLLQVNEDKSKRLLEPTIRQGIPPHRSNWSKHMAPQPRLAMQRNFRP